MRRATAATILAVFILFMEIPVAAGDGLAVGVTGESIGSIANGGAVNVLYGDSGGLTDVGSQMWNQDTAGIPGMAEEDDQFGTAIASGDFNGDGRGDLAIGVPDESVGGVESAGLVHVLYSDGAGVLSADGNQWWYQGLNGLPETPEEGESFASALAAGDFDGDGIEDLAVGVPFEDRGGVFDAGAVHVIYGSAFGLTSTGNQYWTQDSPGVRDTAEENDAFGSCLVAGDFDGDGFSDLAIGIPWEAIDIIPFAGAVNVLYGSAGGLTSEGDGFFTHPFGPQALGVFAHRLAAGDLNADGHGDLAVGTPNMDHSGANDAGTVAILFGSADGLSTNGVQVIAQGLNLFGWPILDQAEAGDEFGGAIAVGDFDGDGFDDLAAAARREDINGIEDAGVVHVLFGMAAGLTGEDNQMWHQDLTSVWGQCEEHDLLGDSLAAGDLNNDGWDDLAVGVHLEDFNSLDSPGQVHIFYGGLDGLTSGLEVWSQEGAVPGDPEEGDYFGKSLTVIRSGFFDGLFADGFETGDVSAWSSTAL